MIRRLLHRFYVIEREPVTYPRWVWNLLLALVIFDIIVAAQRLV